MKTKLLLSLVLSLCMLPLWAYDFQVKNEDGIYISYNLLSSTECQVANNNYTGDIKIPSSVIYNGNSLNVTSIADGAFQYCRDLLTVTIPNSVTSIGKNAFENCFKMTSVAFSTNTKLDDIKEYTFSSCYKLASIIIPDGVTSIGKNAFSNCLELTSVIMPNSVITVGDYAFCDCI